MSSPRQNRRTVLTTTAAIAGTAIGGVALAACSDDGNTGGAGGGNTAENGAGSPSPAPAGERVAALGDVPVGGSTAIKTPSGEDAILSRRSETEVAAFSAVCTHQGCQVAPEGAELKCPCHGSVFDAFTGEVKGGPAERPLPAVNVTIEGENVVTA